MNRFPWDLRYDDPVQTPGAFYAGEGPRGPKVLPGDYQVKLTVGGKSQAAPLKIAMDPRIKDADVAVQKQFELSMQVRDRISQLHQAVNEIRDLKSQIQSLHKKFGEEERAKAALDTADDLNKKMSAVEEQLIQVNMKSSEGNLVFPNMLNERFDTFSHTIDGANAAPTQPQYDVFKMLSEQLDEQLQRWTQLKTDDVPKVGAAIKQLDLPALIISQNTEPAK
jgi:predicted nuclease with TOPRIM domain